LEKWGKPVRGPKVGRGVGPVEGGRAQFLAARASDNGRVGDSVIGLKRRKH